MEDEEGLEHSGLSDSTHYFECDEFTDVENSLALVESLLGSIQAQPHDWKWIVIAAHSALQSACVCFLTKTDGSGALCQSREKALLRKLYGEENGARNLDNPEIDWPLPYLASLEVLLGRLPEGLRVVLPAKEAESWSYDQAGDLRRLCEYRDSFSHFRSIGWSLELSGLPRIICQAICLVDGIAARADYPRVNRFPDTRVRSLTASILSMMDR